MPDGSDRTERISQDVTDISSSSQLLRYATAGQLEHLQTQHRAFSQGKIAHGAGLGSNSRNAGAALSTALKKGLSADQIGKLDGIIGALAEHQDGTGGLSSLALRLSGEGRDEVRRTMTTRLPPSWTSRIFHDPPTADVGVLIQASALLSAFMSASKMDTAGTSVDSIRARYRDHLEPLVRRLIVISVEPPTSRNYDAQILLGILASYCFDQMRVRLEHELRYSPMGFRVWRAITKLVKLSGRGRHADTLKDWVRPLVEDAEDLRKRSLYAGRGLDLELAISVPRAWSPPSDDWAGKALLARARESEATIRERGTAAMGLWQRAISEGRDDLAETEQSLRQLIAEFRDPDSRPDAARGLAWVATQLEYVMDQRIPVCNEFPDVDEPWFRHVQEAADELDKHIPAHLLTGTKNLFRHMILQNAGVYRRQAIETIVTSGWNEPVARALGILLKKEEDEAWLRVRVEFALGFMQNPSAAVEADLTRACKFAFDRLELDQRAPNDPPPRARRTEIHSSLFAVGDCFGVAGAEERARTARESLRPVLTALAELDGDRARILRRATRAAAYVLTLTAQPREGNQPDLSEVLLTKLSGSPDAVTATLSSWALSFRFAEDGSVRPLLAAADLARDMRPY
jgi:hypothetical protein